ncbi:mevalonate kinase [Virgibacillus sp. MSP4-1]|uniref:mevalonate kinase n=1 Tax=Virgibacillus sp. MSP4-1 TaxID=2700081 RepID=UPI00039A06F8|nr:mevalonate kinase [Virgibacillus sp. MSP4-1]QHS21931.1 mevalonate kinase [Virgibacillus sp. MSP4-1]
MRSSSQIKGEGTAHSKLILIGEHSVVYGEPAIALPFPLLMVKSTIQEGAGEITISSDFYNGPLGTIPDRLEGIAVCIRESLKFLAKPAKDIHFTIKSMIPIGRGLGSSAAIATSVVRSLFSYFEKTLSHQMLMYLVDVAEKYAHGNPSGIDMECVSRDVPIWFKKGEAIQPIEMGVPLNLVVADSGRIGDTRAAVTAVREKYEKHYQKARQSIKYIGDMTRKAKSILAGERPEKLGGLLNKAQEELMKLGVSDGNLNELVTCARNAGALGAKLTGGGRGGCIVALAKNMEDAEHISDSLKAAGAKDTWFFTLGMSQSASMNEASRGDLI